MENKGCRFLALSATFLLFLNLSFAQTNTPYYYNALNANNISIKLDNIGGLEYNYLPDTSDTYNYYSGAIWDLLNYSTQLNQIVYDQGLWFVGKIGEEKKTSIAMWSAKYSPGPIIENQPAMVVHPEDSLRYRTYKISKGDNNSNIDYAEWPTDFGAPTASSNDPLIKGDQTLWTVYNGLNQSVNPSWWEGNDIPIEIRQTAFSHNGNGTDEENIFNNVVFLEWEIINKGNVSIDSSYIGFWTDIDFFGAYNNLPAVDTLHQLGYCWDNIDPNYNPLPGIRPAVGYTLLYGPIIPSENSTAIFRGKQKNNFKNLPMSSFHPIGDDATLNPLDGPPSTINEVWYISQGFDVEGKTIIDSTTKQTTKFPFSGDPITGDGWIYPNGRSGGGAGFVFFSGPFNLAPNDTQWVMVALVPGLGNDRYESIKVMREKVELLRSLPYDTLAFGSEHYFITDVNNDIDLSTKFELSQNYPNPFNPTTTIKYQIPDQSLPVGRQVRNDKFSVTLSGVEESLIQLKVYDILGREVKTLVNEKQKPGNYTVEFDANALSSGVYFYKLGAGGFIETKKMILLR